ncbi:MAG TPA: hypothetical protein ENI06_08635 [Spirochaetales bacterium]|nr:hypothetical protein [Spirochaetales bacterium]
MLSEHLDMVIVGHLSRDIIVVDGGRQEATGGAVYFAAFAAKPACSKILVITKLALADVDLLSDFWQKGIPVLPLFSLKTTIMEDSFDSGENYVRKSKVLSLASSFRIEEIPVKSAEVFYLAGLMQGEIPETLIEELSRYGKIALDVQGFLRAPGPGTLVLSEWREKEKYLPYVHFLKADRREAHFLTGNSEIEDMIRSIHEWGVKEILITDDQGVTVSDGIITLHKPFDRYRIEARTGRGDTCFASYLSWRINHDTKKSLDYCLRITNRKLCKPGPYRC